MPAFGTFPIRTPPRFASGLLILLCLAALAAGCGKLKREKEQQAAGEERCLELAIKADAHRKPYLPALLQGNGEWVIYHSKGDPDVYHGGECERELLRGCLLPPEEYSTVEEFKYRLRHCHAFSSCPEYPQQAAALQAEKLEIRQRKNAACRTAVEHNGKGSDCIFEMRRLTAVIETLTALETVFEERCGFQ